MRTGEDAELIRTSSKRRGARDFKLRAAMTGGLR